MKMIIAPERYREIRRKAAIVYYKHDIRSLPVIPFYILRSYHKKLSIYSYKEFAEQRYDGDLEAMKDDFGDVPGCTVYNEKHNKYMVFLNEKAGVNWTKGRPVWTLAHEFGHIVLNHHIATLDSLIVG